MSDALADYTLASFDGMFFAAQSDAAVEPSDGARLLARAVHHLAQQHL